MARLLLAVLGWRFEVELGRDEDDDTEDTPEPAPEPERRGMFFYGDVVSNPLGFAPSFDAPPYEAVIPDRE